jgi:phosphatidylinositol 3,5-bisphosphate 5-phosphatase
MSEHLTNISVYETAQKVYIVGEDKEQDDCWRLLKIDRANINAAEELSVVEDPTLYSWRELQSVLRCLQEGNISSGGLRKIAGPCPAIVGACFSWAANPYLLLVTKTRTLGHIGDDNPIYGIDATSLIPLGLPGEPLPESIAAAEARARRLLSLVDLNKNFFFSFSWPIWNTVQRTLASELISTKESGDQMQDDAFSSDRVWNEHLTARLRSSLGSNHSRWVVPLVHGFFEQKQLSLLGRLLLLTLVARRSCRFAGTRYRKRGVTDDGEVANDVEIEQIVELIDNSSSITSRSNAITPNLSSVVQVRGSVPLFWSQTWDSSTAAATAALRPSIRMLHHLDPLYTATRKHFDDLRKRYGNGTIQCLDLLRHGDSRQQESVLSAEFKNAITFLNRRSPVAQRVGYVHWDLRKHAKMAGSSILVDLQRVQAPLLASTSIFTTATTGGSNQKQENEQIQLQHGLVRTNCVDCLDRTNVAQFIFGLLAIGQQLHSLGLVPSAAPIDPGSSLAAELMGSYEAMGHALAQQYGGSEAHTGFFKQQTTKLTRGEDDWQTNLHLQGRDLLTSLKRFYSNAVTDEDKQAAINLFLGTFSPAMAAAETAKWGGWLRGRAASTTELGGGDAGRSGTIVTGGNLLLAPEPSLEDTATRTVTTTNNNPNIHTESLSRTSSLFLQGQSPPGTPLPSSLSTASLGSELDGGTDLSLHEILSSAVPIIIEVVEKQQGSAVVGVNESGKQAQQQQQQQQRKQWPPRLPPRTYSSPLLASVPSSDGGLQSFDAMLPRDVRYVRLSSYSQRVSKARPAAAGTTQAPAAFARGPSAPPARLVRSNSTGNTSQLAFESARNTVLHQQQRVAASNANNSTRSARDLRGNLVILGPGDSVFTRNNDQVSDTPVLPHATSGYHTLAGLNLEGAPELTNHLPGPYTPTFTRPSTAGNMPRVKRVSFASLAALKQFVVRGSSGGSDGGGGGGSNKSKNGAASGYASRIASRSASDMNLNTLPATYNTNATAATAGRTRMLGGAGIGPAASTDLSWMFTQHQAVAHGLDDLGLPPHIAPLYRRGSNVVSCFVELGKQATEEQALAMAKLAVPMDPAEHRAAEREAAALLRPEVVVTLPEKAF